MGPSFKKANMLQSGSQTQRLAAHAFYKFEHLVAVGSGGQVFARHRKNSNRLLATQSGQLGKAAGFGIPALSAEKC